MVFVIAGVGGVKGVAEFLEAWVLDAAVFFVAGFGREDWIGAAREVNPIGTLGIAEARGTRSVLRTVEHDEFAGILFVGILGPKKCNGGDVRCRPLPPPSPPR